jgi:hypothetical protein
MYMSAMIKTPKIYWLLISLINDETLPNKRKSSQLQGQREAPKKKRGTLSNKESSPISTNPRNGGCKRAT